MATSVSNPVFLSGAKTVAAAGTAEALSTTERVKSVLVLAKVANTGTVFLGGSDVDSSTNGGLAPGDSIRITPSKIWMDLADVFIDVSVNGEGVDFYAIKA